uniref:Uncharacterized protein n=2 Tax=viral metagenome TaxID=1070528 RepID=A0A6M3LE72_9ZZZZ
MPKKLLKCIADVMATGKDKSTAIAICVKSTGLKMEKDELDKMLKEKGIVEGVSNKSWAKVNKSKLPSSAFLIVGDPEKKSTWKLPYKEENGDVNLGALRAIAAAVAGARTGKPMTIPTEVKTKIEKLLKQYKIGQYANESAEDVSYFESELAKLNFLETIKEENTTIGFYEYRRT